MLKNLVLVISLWIWASSAAQAETLQDFLRAFHVDPAREMQRLPSLVDEKGNAIPRGYIQEDSAEWRTLLSQRDQFRAKLIGSKSLLAGPMEGHDSADVLAEPGSSVVKSLTEINARGLTQASLPISPWTDSYWPLAKGNTGMRYSDKNFPDTKDWRQNHAYIIGRPASAVVASGNREEIDALSPAEKYDFAMGDSSYALTSYAWRTGQSLFEKHGQVPYWMGICHGWAAASHMMVEIPKHPVDVIAANGTHVTFFPQDVKALQSMLWANASPAVRFAGQRCNVPRPEKNQYGRIIDKGCFDVNPATLHLGLTHQMGVHQRSMIMDATYDLEVWNHPVSSYRFRYFNPQTWKESVSPTPSIIPLDSFKLDKFREFRSAEAKSVIGILMDVTYVVEINPTRRPFEPVPPVKTLRFIYDLELDAGGNIIGGEWYSNAHPDFLWTHDSAAHASSPYDNGLREDPWNTSLPVPTHWSVPASRASARGVPLASFLSRISHAATTPETPDAPESP